MGKFGKLIAAGVGLVVMLLATVFGIGDGETLLGMDQATVVQAIISLGTAFGVFQVTNTPAA